MAAPSPRRPGFSRKAQYGLFAAYVIAVVGAVAGLLLVLISAFDPTGFAALRSITAEIFAPVSRSATTVVGSVGTVDENISAYIKAGSQNKQLRRELETAQNKIIEARALVDENARLRALLKLRDESSDAIVISRLISSTASSTRRFATLDAGSMQRVRSGQPVRSSEGLIGRVLEVGPTTARILLLSDAESVIPVRRASDGLPATVTGLGDGTVQIQLLETSLSAIKAGDLFVTSGSGGMYRPNIPVAIATRKGDDNAMGRAIADPAKVDTVMVQQAYQADVKPPPTTDELLAEAEKRAAAEKAKAKAASGTSQEPAQ